MTETFNMGQIGAAIAIQNSGICITVSPIRPISAYERGNTGRFNYVDASGNLLVTLKSNLFVEDNLSNQLDGSKITFNLIKQPQSNSFSLFWNGVKQDKFVLNNKILTTYFKPYKDNSLIALYIEEQ